MKLCCLLALAWFTAAACFAQGHLMVVGGGKTNPDFIREALALGGGVQARVAILAQASALADSGEKSGAMWRELGATEVAVLAVLADPRSRAQLESATVLWMPGGDQNKLMAAVNDAGLGELIRQRYRDGAVVGGTSAGAAVMSELMLTGEADLTSISPGATKLAPGLALWPEVIVDQHFVKRQRFARLLSAVLDRPEKIGVGIDEETAVLVSAGAWKILGKHCVLVIDARAAKPGEPASATGLALHILRAGMTWHP